MKNGELSDPPDRRSIQWRNEEHFNCFFFLQYPKQMPEEKREFHLVGRHDLLSPSSLPIEKCDTHTGNGSTKVSGRDTIAAPYRPKVHQSYTIL